MIRPGRFCWMLFLGKTHLEMLPVGLFSCFETLSDGIWVSTFIHAFSCCFLLHPNTWFLFWWPVFLGFFSHSCFACKVHVWWLETINYLISHLAVLRRIHDVLLFIVLCLHLSRRWWICQSNHTQSAQLMQFAVFFKDEIKPGRKVRVLMDFYKLYLECQCLFVFYLMRWRK